MVEFNPHIKLVVDNTTRKTGQSARPSPARRSEDDLPLFSPDTVSVIASENRRAAQASIPTQREAWAAMDYLEKNLPGLGQEVGDLHSHLDRRVILSLLAPLVE